MSLRLMILFFLNSLFRSSALSLTEYNNGFQVPKCRCVPLEKCPEIINNFVRTREESINIIQEYSNYIWSYLACGVRKDLICCPNHHLGKGELSHPLCGRDINRDKQFGDVTELAEFPWLALLEYETQLGRQIQCGGAIINEEYVLTGAHCIVSSLGNLSSVILGEYNTSTLVDCVQNKDFWNSKTCAPPALRMGIAKVVYYDGYGRPPPNFYMTDDIVLIKLQFKVQFTKFIQPICLPSNYPRDQRFFIGGWGRSAGVTAKEHTVKKRSKLTQLNPDRCENNFVESFNVHYLCAGERTRAEDKLEQACFLDSGGPLMGLELKEDGSRRMTIYGLTMGDPVCDAPNVFTRVNEFIPWILNIIH